MEEAPALADQTVARRRHRIRPELAVAMTAFALMGLFVGVRLAFHKGDSSVFMLAGDLVVDPAEAPSNLTIYKSAYGYDGERYYRLARNPFTTEVKEFGIEFSRPAYWQQRIGYPFLAWIVSGFGQESLTPEALILTNLLACAAIAGLAARMALDHRRSPWWGLLPAMWGGYVVGIAQDLTEVVCGAFLLGGILAIQRRRWGIAVACLTAAALTRESSLIFSVAVLFTSLSPLVRKLCTPAHPVEAVPKSPPVWVGAAPIGLYLAWRLWIRSLWSGAIPGGPESDALLGPPLIKLLEYGGQVLRDPLGADVWNVPELILTIVAVVVLIRILISDGTGLPHERLAFAATVGLLICLPVWTRGQAYLRWTCEPVMLGWVLALGAPAKKMKVLSVVVALLWLVTVGEHLRFPGLDHTVDRQAVVGVEATGTP